MTSPSRDFLGEGLAELKGTIEKSMQNCNIGDEDQIEERHNDEFLEAIQADVSELARMVAAERRDSASHTIGEFMPNLGCGDDQTQAHDGSEWKEILNQLRRIVDENHRLILSLTEETFQSKFN